jgi:hypothetical protein
VKKIWVAVHPDPFSCSVSAADRLFRLSALFYGRHPLDGVAISIYSENAGLTSQLYRQVRFALLMIHRLCAAWLLYGLLCGCQSAAIAFQSNLHPLAVTGGPGYEKSVDRIFTDRCAKIATRR